MARTARVEAAPASKLLGVRVTPDEHETVKGAAAERGLDVSALVRGLLAEAGILPGTGGGPANETAEETPAEAWAIPLAQLRGMALALVTDLARQADGVAELADVEARLVARGAPLEDARTALTRLADLGAIEMRGALVRPLR